MQDSKRVDPKIMADLMDEMGVKEFVAQMTPDELEFYQKMLVSQGIYDQYVKERGLEHGRRL